jgi:PAS domain S-box-containing protein
MNNSFNRNLRLGYGISLLLLLTVGILSYITMDSLLSSNRWVAHSNLVMQRLEKALSLMTDAETGERGYLLTGRSQFLEPYHGSPAEALGQLDQALQLTKDNPSQQNNILAIRQVLQQRMDILKTQIDRKTKGEAITQSDLEAGKAAMDALRQATDKAEAEEQRLLKVRTNSLKFYTSVTPWFIIIALIVGIGIGGYSFIRAMRDVKEKDRLYNELKGQEEETAALNEELAAANEEIMAANEELTAANEELAEARVELMTANDRLEQKVVERTRELADSEEETQALNEELTAINEELAAANEELQSSNEDLGENQHRLQQYLSEMTLAEERSAKLAAIVESSDDAIIGKTLEGVITSWNRGAEQIFGYTEEEMIGQPVLKLIPEDRHYEEPIILSRLSKGERIEHYETIRQRKDGSQLYVSLTISPIRNKAGEIIGVSKIARDITEQKHDEQRKSDFIGMASHELKTPLTSLTALIQVLQQKLRDSDGFTTNVLTKAHLQTKKMSALINGFLNVSRLESGKLSIEKQSFDLNTLINELIEETQLTVSSHAFVFESPEKIIVNADREKIGSVLSNLLSNAVKYSPKGGTVTTKLSRTNGEVIVIVKDEGIGINRQDIDRLFDRYYRVQNENTRHISGFGVGLYLSAEIIQRHGGRIWAESEKGNGSTFYFTLPLV